jgi:cysteinyl-tRNA synthetase
VTIRVYNTATQAREVFEPIEPDHVRLYVCGPTVYDFAHIGNARPEVVFDTLVRLLRRRFDKVTYVRNITDVDDKINNAAREEGVGIEEITRRTTEAFHEDMAALGALPPDVEPRATDHIPEMIRMIETLIAKGHAYEAEGHVLFAVPSMPDYGAFARRNPDELIAGARVEVAPYKRDAMDFVLWKPSDGETPGWPSPWGRGRPGWHIECSAMSKRYLGVTFDIHGGGLDLIFPHHQNEIAQSTCAHDGAALANYWMHNGYVVVEGEKMSKSLGNFFTVRELLAEFPGEAIRLALLAAHYRQPLDFTREGLARAKQTLDRWYRAVGEADAAAEPPESVMAALEDDLNTPQAITEMHRLADAVFKGDETVAADLKAAGEVMGLLPRTYPQWARDEHLIIPDSANIEITGHSPELTVGPSAEAIEMQIDIRSKARKNKDFETSDRIRDELAAQGVILEDKPDGTTEWRRA